MQTLIFKILIYFINFIRPVVTLLVFCVSFFQKKLRQRVNFEKKNLNEEACHSFNKNLPTLKAQVCFEVSSEGELEQVRPLIEECLKQHKKIEIIYSSPSVEKKCQDLYSSDPKHIRLLRMPLLLSMPFSFGSFQSVANWMTAPTLIFCRYDFFPELLVLKFKKDKGENKKFILISGATKKLDWYKKECFKLFDIVVGATEIEKNKFIEILDDESKPVYNCDLRIPRISQRHNHFVETIKKVSFLHSYIEKIKTIDVGNKIIIGSSWESDLLILKNQELIEQVKKGLLHITIAPHKLGEEFVSEIKSKCIAIFGGENVGVINKDNPMSDAPVVVLQVGGILCELYGYFGISYVGGGFERSIHSCLEPFLSGCIVFCGPKIHRSTEYDYIKSNLPLEIEVLKNPELFYDKVKEKDVMSRDLEKRFDLMVESRLEMQRIFDAII